MKKLLSTLSVLFIAHLAIAQCNPAFTATMSPQNNNLLRLQLSNTTVPPTGLNKIISYIVYWGDGFANNVSAGNNYHNYTSPNTYNVKMIMTVWDSVGSTTVLVCKDSVTQSVTVAYAPCASSFSITNNSPLISVAAVTPAGTSGVTYSWNWGDSSPASTGANASHNYSSTGVKTITLTATNGSCTYTNIGNTPINSICDTAIDFTYYQSGGTDMSFSTSQPTMTGKAWRFDWILGDGNSIINTPNGGITHTYATGGTYSVKFRKMLYSTPSYTLLCIDSVTKSVTIIDSISGWIFLDDSATIPSVDTPTYKVWLISFDATTNTLSAVDSLTVTANVQWGNHPIASYVFQSPPYGTYRIKAAMLNGPTSGAGWIPTYYLAPVTGYTFGTLTWNTASTFVYNGGLVREKHIEMLAGTVTTGPGFIGGNVSAGANKGTGTGIEGMTVLLLDANGKMINGTTTDLNGNYFFDKLPPAAYSIYPEDLGFATTPSTVSVVNNKPTVTNINFERSNSQKTISPAPTAINNVDNYTVEFRVYPNPAKDNITISWNSAVTNAADVTLTDITGKKVYTTTVTGNGNAVLSVGDLQKGFYFITISSNGVHVTQKLLLQ